MICGWLNFLLRGVDIVKTWNLIGKVLPGSLKGKSSWVLLMLLFTKVLPDSMEYKDILLLSTSQLERKEMQKNMTEEEPAMILLLGLVNVLKLTYLLQNLFKSQVTG